MKIKKLIALVLCAIMTCFTLAGCKEEVIGDYLKEYDWWKPEVIVKLNYDLYIISNNDDGEDGERSEATVQAKINQYLDEAYNTTVTIHYISEDEYSAAIDKAVASAGKASTSAGSRINAGSIILVAGEDMYKSLVEDNCLVDLRGFLDTNEFGKLNTQITPTVLDSAKVDVDGTEKLFVIPNDHVVGQYTYTVINREIAEGQLNFSAQSELHDMKIIDGVPNEIAKELIASVEENYEGAVEDVIRVEYGKYEDKAAWESKGYICNISEYPEVTSDVTFAAGFGILKQPTFDFDLDQNAETGNEELLNKRAMEVVYSINANEDVRNLLQYGVEYTNYEFEEKTVTNSKGEEIVVKYVVPYEENPYKMNLLYTGDMFNAYYCEDDVWTIDGVSGAWTYYTAENGNKQNEDSYIKE